MTMVAATDEGLQQRGPDRRSNRLGSSSSKFGPRRKPKAMIDPTQLKCFVWYDQANQMVYYHKGTDVFGAPEGNAVDANTGCLIGRWGCSIAHWNMPKPLSEP